jgi:hypothetical protein
VQDTKLGLSEEELKAITDTTFFLLKHSATKKIMELYGGLEKEMKDKFSRYKFDVKNLNASSGKIFRGENYRLFPYILLDYPRLFNVNSVFAFRTMFWWGNEFSFTLHLQGEALDQYRNLLREKFELLLNKEVYICVNDTPWQYHFGNDNYILLDDAGSKMNELLDNTFIKLCRKIGAGEVDRMPGYCLETFDLFFGLLNRES